MLIIGQDIILPSITKTFAGISFTVYGCRNATHPTATDKSSCQPSSLSTAVALARV
jgi:hypothetical protein